MGLMNGAFGCGFPVVQPDQPIDMPMFGLNDAVKEGPGAVLRCLMAYAQKAGDTAIDPGFAQQCVSGLEQAGYHFGCVVSNGSPESIARNAIGLAMNHMCAHVSPCAKKLERALRLYESALSSPHPEFKPPNLLRSPTL